MLSDSNSTVQDQKKTAGGTTPQPHFHVRNQFRFLVKPVLATKLRLMMIIIIIIIIIIIVIIIIIIIVLLLLLLPLLFLLSSWVEKS